MSKEKLKNLTKYVSDMENKLASTVIPAKHVNNVDTYRQFLRNEIKSASAKLEVLKLDTKK